MLWKLRYLRPRIDYVSSPLFKKIARNKINRRQFFSGEIKNHDLFSDSEPVSTQDDKKNKLYLFQPEKHHCKTRTKFVLMIIMLHYFQR